MSIIITGASGFVGQNLKRYLQEKGKTVYPLSLRDSKWMNELPKEADALIHLAGKAHDTSNTSQEVEYFQVNRDLTIAIFEEFLKSEIRDFFYFSSVKAVADTTDGILVEDVNAKPFTPYGKSKLEAEQYILNKELPAGKRVFIIRPCMIHGPGNKGNLNLLYKIVEKGMPWPLASFENQRSFLSIDNLSFMVNSILDKREIASGVYNFADDVPLSTNELIELIASVLKKKVKLWKVSKGLISTIVKVGDVLPLPLNSDRLKKLTESYVVSNAKIKHELGIQHLPISTQAGLKITIESFKQANS